MLDMDELINTDGPMTRGKMKAMEQAGLTPAELGALRTVVSVGDTNAPCSENQVVHLFQDSCASSNLYVLGSQVR